MSGWVFVIRACKYDDTTELVFWFVRKHEKCFVCLFHSHIFIFMFLRIEILFYKDTWFKSGQSNV